MKFQEIQERCWTGYEQQGMKKKGNRQVPNCVPVEEVKTGPEITGKDLLFKAAAMAIRDASHEGVSLDYEQAIRQASKLYGIPYQPSELPRLLAQRAEIDRQLALLKQGKQVAKARRQEKQAPTPAGAEEYWKSHALTTDRIKPATKTLEAVDPFLDSYARDLLGLVVMAGGAFAVGTYYTIRNKLKKYQGSQIIDALERKGVTMNRKTYEQVKPLLDQFRQALKDDEGEQAKMLAQRIEQMIVMGKLSAPEPQAQDTALAAKEKELAEDLKKWFKEKWVRFGPDGKIRGDCARGSDSEGKPKCLPQAKAQALGKKGRAASAAKKRREDPNPERRGSAKNVATRVKEQYTDDDDWYDDEDQEIELRSGDYVRDQMDGESGEVFRMQGDPYERRVRILDRDGRGWYIEPSRLTRVDSTDPDIQRYFGKQRQRDMDEAISKKDLVVRLQKDLPKVTDPKNKNAQSVAWTGPGKEDYGYTGYQGHGMPTDRQERDRLRADKKKGVAETANVNPQFIDTQVTKILAGEARRMTNAPMAQLLAPVMKQYGLTLQQIDGMVPGGLKKAAASYGIMMKEGWSDAVVARRTGSPRTPYAVYIKGKKWKDFENEDLAQAIMNKLKAKFKADGRDPETVTIAPTQTTTAPVQRVAASNPTQPMPATVAETSTIMSALKQVDEKQDACYSKVKSRYKVWPSAYASGALVQCRKKGAANWGNKNKK